MNLISKIAAVVLFAASAATIASAAPAPTPAQLQAPTQRIVPGIVIPPAPAPVCCQLATKPVVTGMPGNPGWSLTLPSNAPSSIFNILSTPSWASIAGTRWIGPAADAGTASYPGGKYVYSFHFCLCGTPQGVNAVPAALSLKVLADDGFTAKLNGNPIGQSTGSAFFAPTTINLASTYFKACNDNYLTFEVTNWSGGGGPQTGLDVSGWISGYFNQPTYGSPCKCKGSPPPYGGSTNPN